MSALFAEAEEEDERRAIDGADWEPLVRSVADAASEVARDGARQALLAIGFSEDEDIFDQVSEDAVEWARERAAELVGRKWKDGDLVDSADAEETILDETREEIRAAVADAIENGDSASQLSERIQGLGAFSEERADRIAQTEMVRANNAGHMTAFRKSGVVEKKSWSTSNQDSVCDVCEGNEDEGAIGIDDDFPSGDDAPPAHPGCLCVVTAEIDDSEDDDSEEDDGESEDDSEDEDGE